MRGIICVYRFSVQKIGTHDHYIWKGIMPALIANIIDGGLFCGK